MCFFLDVHLKSPDITTHRSLSIRDTVFLSAHITHNHYWECDHHSHHPSSHILTFSPHFVQIIHPNHHTSFNCRDVGYSNILRDHLTICWEERSKRWENDLENGQKWSKSAQQFISPKMSGSFSQNVHIYFPHYFIILVSFLHLKSTWNGTQMISKMERYLLSNSHHLFSFTNPLTTHHFHPHTPHTSTRTSHLHFHSNLNLHPHHFHSHQLKIYL